MAANTAPIYILTANSKGVSFVNADGTTAKTVFTAGSNGSRIFGLAVTSTDTAAIQLDIWLRDGTTDYQLGSVAIAIGAGTLTTVPPVNALTTTTVPGLASDGSWFLPTGWTVKVAPHAAVTAAKTLIVIAHGGDY